MNTQNNLIKKLSKSNSNEIILYQKYYSGVNGLTTKNNKVPKSLRKFPMCNAATIR